MKKASLKFTAVFLILLYTISVFTISVSTAVSYTNSKGTATVVCGKYKKKFKAKKFGHNFSKALNEALNTARKKAKADKPAVVTVSKGNYKLDRTLKIYSNTTLNAKGSTFKYYGNLLRNGYNGKASRASGYNGASNITIDGGIWDAAVPYSQAGTANWRIQHSTLRFGHCKNITIQNCEFRNNYNCHDIEFGGVNNGKITNCKFYNDKPVNTFKNDGGRESIQLDVNTSAAMPEFGNFDNTPTKNITLSYCDFKNKFRAIGSHHAVLGNPFDNIKVHHNNFRDIGGITVYSVYWTNSKIYSNNMEYVGLGVDMRNMTTGTGYNFNNTQNLTAKQCNNVVANSRNYIYDNTITIRKKNNTYTRACGIRVMGDYYNKRDKVTGVKAGQYNIYNINVGVNAVGTPMPNIIKGNVAVGIQLNYAVDSVVSNNEINAGGSVSETSNGIEIKGSENVTVSNNTVKKGYKEKARAVFLTTTEAGFGNKNITVSDNKVSNFSSSGIYVDSANNSLIENNNVSKTSDMGVSVKESVNTKVESNTIKNIKTSSVCVYSDSKATEITENEISSSEKTALRIRESTDTKIKGNSVTDCGEYGCLIRECSNTEFDGNTLSNTASYGVRVNYGSNDTKLYNNTIYSPKAECVYLNSSNDATPEVEKKLEVSNNYLDTSEKTAAVAVSKGNVAARIYSNFRNDGKDIYYSFKGDDDDKYRKVYVPLSVDDLSVERFDEYNLLNWNSSENNISYRVYREDETGSSLISDTSEKYCMDNAIYKDQPTTDFSDVLLRKETNNPKIKILSYSVSPYKTFSDIKYLGEPISVDFEQE